MDIRIASQLAELLAVPQLSAVLKIAQPLALGIQSLFSAGNGSLHLGWKQVYDHSDLKAGYVVVIRATEQDVEPNKLWVVDKQLREGNTQAGSQPFDRFDFMLLRFDVFEERDDFDKLTYIEEPFQQALDALQSTDSDAVKKADFFIQTALRRVFKSPDLTQADRTRIIFALKDRYKQAKDAFGTAGLVTRDIRFSKVITGSMSAAAAFTMAPPTEDDVLNVDV